MTEWVRWECFNRRRRHERQIEASNKSVWFGRGVGSAAPRRGNEFFNQTSRRTVGGARCISIRVRAERGWSVCSLRIISRQRQVRYLLFPTDDGRTGAVDWMFPCARHLRPAVREGEQLQREIICPGRVGAKRPQIEYWRKYRRNEPTNNPSRVRLHRTHPRHAERIRAYPPRSLPDLLGANRQRKRHRL